MNVNANLRTPQSAAPTRPTEGAKRTALRAPTRPQTALAKARYNSTPTAPVARYNSTPPPSEPVTEYAHAISTRKRDPRQILLLYNDRCATCRKIASWIVRDDSVQHGGKQLVDARAIGGDPKAFAKVVPNLDYYDAYTTPHVVMPDGTVKAGGEAIAEVLMRLPETRWFAWLFKVHVGSWRPFQGMLNGSYYLLDHLRPALGCESCGEREVPWWGKPIAWTVQGVQKLAGLLHKLAAHKDVPKADDAGAKESRPNG